MKKTFMNTVHLEGYLYEHELAQKETGPNSKNPGTPFIAGTISLATDEACLNIVPIHFTYVTAMTAKGNQNSTYTTLLNIIEGRYKSIIGSSKEEAVKLEIDTAIALNEFYSDRSGKEELVSVKRNEGGFVHVVPTLKAEEAKRNFFKLDMLITSVIRKEADDERQLPEKAIVKGAIFNFRKELLPVEFSVIDPRGMDYFENLGVSNTNPTFTWVEGTQISETVRRQIVRETAFGGDSVDEVTSTRKDFVLTKAAREAYEWDSEETLTAKELGEMISAREISLATIKQRQDEYNSNRKAPAAAPIPAVNPNTTFNF